MSMSAEEYAYQIAHIHDDRRPKIVAAIVVLMLLSSIAMLLRLVVRFRTKARLQADDFTVFLAYLLAWGSFTCIYYETRNGLGKHLVAASPEQFEAFIKYLLFSGPAYVIGVMFTQLSFLFLYKRVFTTQVVWFANTLYVLAALSFAAGISIFFSAILQCTPFKYRWDRTITGHCINVNALWIVDDALNLIIDVCIVVAPIPLVWHLQMSLRTKCAVVGMFLLGGFVVVMNLIRLPQLIHIPVVDLTYNYVPAAVYTHAELCLGIVSACLPCFKPLFREMVLVPTDRSKSSLEPQHHFKAPLDRYTMLHGQEPWANGSKSMLVPVQERVTLPQSRDHGIEGKATLGVRSDQDVELGLSTDRRNSISGCVNSGCETI